MRDSLTGCPDVESTFERIATRLHRRIRIGSESYVSAVKNAVETGDDLADWWRAFLDGARPSATVARGRIRSLDLFCGPGGLALGFGQAAAEMGYEFISEAAVDGDDGATRVYQANHGSRRTVVGSIREMVDFQVRGNGDAATFRYEPEIVARELQSLVGTVDVVLAGPPCQGHSNLNNHTRRTDRRNDLYLTVPAFAVAVGAEMVVIENVPAVIHDRQQVVATTKRLLEDNGYRVTTGRLGAHQLGWPQTRQRFFLLARKGVAPLATDIVQAALGRPEPLPLWWALADLEDESPGGPMTPATELSEENRRRIRWLFEHDAHELPLQERPVCHQDGTTYGAVYGRLKQGAPAPTITSGFMTPGRGRYIHPTRERTLTPHEAARLQGFPDTYRFHPDVGQPSSKAQLSKWIGDAVPMPLGHAAGVAVLGPRAFHR